MKGLKNVILMSFALGMLIYSVPQLDFSNGYTMASIFGIVWICMALLVIAAHLHEILGVDQEQKQELIRIKRMKRWQLVQAVQGKRRILQFKK
jgi:flagellar biosynthesis protein FliR